MKKVSALLAVALLSSAPAWASPVGLSYSSTASNLVAFGNDTIQLTGQAGSLTADNAVTTSHTINLASFIADYTVPSPPNSPLGINLSFDLTLGGYTHTLSQSALFAITTALDTVSAAASSASTSFGAWQVTLQSWSVSAGTPGRFTTNVVANVTYVPEPATLALFGLGLAGIGLYRRKRV